MSTGPSQRASEDARRWRIIFLTDTHGFLDGSGVNPRRGGLAKILELVPSLRFEAMSQWEKGAPPATVVLCFGGDILRGQTHRLLYDKSAVRIWDCIVEKFAPDVIVLGNHELKDFGVDFATHVIQNSCSGEAHPGCTRNIEWLDEDNKNGIWCRAGRRVPRSSIHSIVGAGQRNGVQLAFVGLVEWKTRGDENRNLAAELGGRGFQICTPAVAITRVLVPHCFGEDKCCGNRILVHVAHYMSSTPGKTRDCPSFLQAFGAMWARGDPWLTRGSPRAPRGGWRRPHLILKGHDHNATEHPLGQPQIGSVSRRSRCESLGGRGKRETMWVPTFSPGAEGRAVGILDLSLGDDKVEYTWETRQIGKATDWEFPGGIPLVWSGMWYRKGLAFTPFGRDDEDPRYLVYAMDLLLRALLRLGSLRDDGMCLALAPACSARPYTLVPTPLSPAWHVRPEDVGPFLTEHHRRLLNTTGTDPDTVVEQAWRGKIDEWDLKHVYGPETWGISAHHVTHIAQLSQGIRRAFETPRGDVLPSTLPFCADSNDALAGLSGDDVPPRAKSMWAMWNGQVYVFVQMPPTQMRTASGGIGIYSLRFDPAARRRNHRFLLSPYGVLCDNNMHRLLPMGKNLVVYTTGFCASRLLCWTGAAGTPVAVKAGGAARGLLSVFGTVRRYIDKLMLDRDDLPFILR